MVLETKRLILRNWNINDAEDLYKYAKDPDVGLPAGFIPHSSIKESKNIIEMIFMHNPESYAVCLKSNNKSIGAITLKNETTIDTNNNDVELGYWLGKPFWGQGLIPEAINEILRHAFEDMMINKVWCIYSDGNNQSKRVLEKCGFKYSYTINERRMLVLNEIRKCHVYYITEKDWNNIK